jgi:hypothetical protein
MCVGGGDGNSMELLLVEGEASWLAQEKSKQDSPRPEDPVNV